MQKNIKTDIEQLRKKAEQALDKGKVTDIKPLTDIQDYIHELQVYQVELEMQADELRRTLIELEVSRDNFFELYNQAPVGYLSINNAGIIRRTNQTFANMLGVSPDILIHKPLSQYIQQEDHSLFYAVCAKAANTHKFRTCELGFIKQEGEIFFGRLDVTLKEEEQSSDPQYRLSVIDITGKKKAEEENLRLVKEVMKAQKEDSLRRLAGGIAHNFNNLLTVVMGNIELSASMEIDANTKEDCLHQAYDSAGKAAELSTMMLSYLGQQPNTKKLIDVVKSVDNLFNILRSTVHGQLQFSYEHANDPIFIEGDPTQLAQIVNNLVTNAVEAIGEQPGKISVTVSQGYFHKKTAPVSLHGEKLKPGMYASISVKDTGHGMIKRVLEKAIDPFFSTRFAGRGLGLSAVWGIVHAHEGFFFLNSEPEKGTLAEVFLPLKKIDPPETKKESDGSMYGFKKGSMVLIADDERVVRRVARSYLQELGFRVVEASGGREAVQLFDQHQDEISFVVIDYSMPDQDGNLTLEQIRSTNANIPALLISGYLQDHFLDSFINQKPNAFLHKPFNRKELREALIEMKEASVHERK